MLDARPRRRAAALDAAKRERPRGARQARHVRPLARGARGGRDGRILFAVDQQPYLQGYLPVVMLAQQARYGLFPSSGQVVATGPHFVTRETASLALQLSSRGIR